MTSRSVTPARTRSWAAVSLIVGAALAFQMRDERVAVAFFGDGATNTGTPTSP
jgi:TPP-dependent pyruvate/acetoin dehydrogenase alpha subunit